MIHDTQLGPNDAGRIKQLEKVGPGGGSIYIYIFKYIFIFFLFTPQLASRVFVHQDHLLPLAKSTQLLQLVFSHLIHAQPKWQLVDRSSVIAGLKQCTPLLGTVCQSAIGPLWIHQPHSAVNHNVQQIVWYQKKVAKPWLAQSHGQMIAPSASTVHKLLAPGALRAIAFTKALL